MAMYIKTKKPQYVHFRCERVHINKLLKTRGKRDKLQQCLSKQEIDHDEIYEGTWENREKEKLPYLKNDDLSTALCFARYSKGMEKLTAFSTNNSLTIRSLANKRFNSLRDESDEPIYT